MMKRPNIRELRPSTTPGGTQAQERRSAVYSHRLIDGVKAGSAPIRATSAPVNTQQLDVDWSKFENHTFFDSAAGKVNAAFLRVVNDFPFDGSESEVYNFVTDLSGYERYIFDSYPTSVGFLKFDGGSYISVNDSAGAEFPEFSRSRAGQKVMEPKGQPFTLQMYLSSSAASNDNQVICQYAESETNGFCLFLSQSASSATARVVFAVTSGSLSTQASFSVDKGAFCHVSAQYSTTSVTSSLALYRDGLLTATSSNGFAVGNTFSSIKMLIGSGSLFSLGSSYFLPKEGFNGAIDDLRLYHSARTPQQLRHDMVYEGFADEDAADPQKLRLYLKMNEPPGSHSKSNIALDSSGFSLHSPIIGYSNSLRVTGSSPVSGEDESLNPVLFPDFAETQALNASLLDDAELYDRENPNYIVKLIPSHYFIEAQTAFGFPATQGDLSNSFVGSSIPGSGQLGSVQILTAILLIYAKQFDELKVFHDHFSRLTYVDYDENESVSDQFLPFLAQYYGIQLPNLFDQSTLEQYFHGQKLGAGRVGQSSLQRVQSLIFRRVLSNMREIVTSKGTHAGIRALLNSAGIAPNSFFKIREYGGSTRVELGSQREDVTEITSVLDFSGSLAPVTPIAADNGFAQNLPHIVSAYLSGSRVEPGYPQPVGTFVNKTSIDYHGVSNSPSDGLLTSGSWTLEGRFKFIGRAPTEQSLARLHVTGSSAPSSTGGVVVNLVAVSGTNSTLSAYVSADAAGSTAPLELHITGADVLNGDTWHVSLGRRRADSFSDVSYLSSSYTLRCERISGIGIVTPYSASAFYREAGVSSNNVFENISATSNASGAFIVIGSQSFSVGSAYSFLNSTANSSVMRVSNFAGKASQIRFWSKNLEEDECLEHARSYRSLGTTDPKINFNFTPNETGSFERLRVDLSCDQPITASNTSGEITIFDFSQNGFHAAGAGFEASVKVIKPEIANFTQLSPRFDINQTDIKVRVRSFTSAESLDANPGSLPAPIYEQIKSERPVSDQRIGIEASAVDAINDDIIKLVSSFDFFERALGDPRVQNEDFYPDLEALRRVYFNRLVGKPDLLAMYNVFQWVSSALGDLIKQIVPMNATYLGISYIVESHVAERSRIKYNFDMQYRTLDTNQTVARSVDNSNISTPSTASTSSPSKR